MAAPVNVNTATPEASQANGAASAVGEGMLQLYKKNELCDVSLRACGEKFHCHKAMLAAMSAAFCGYIGRRPNETSAVPPEVEAMARQLVPFVEPAAAAPAESNSAAPEAAATDAAQGQAATPAAEGSAPPPATEAKEGESTAEKKAEKPAETGTEGAAPSQGDAAAPEGQPAAAEKKEEPAPAAEAPKPARASGSHFLDLELVEVRTAECVRILLDYLYSVGTSAGWEYAPSSLEVNRDVLLLARLFGLPHLHEHSARWLAKGLTTGNVVSRLVICEEFGLGLLRDKIIEQLTANPTQLTMVSTSAEIMKHPKILQDLLVQVASICGAGGAPAKDEKEAVPAAKEDTGKGKRVSISKNKEEAQEPPPAAEKRPANASQIAAAKKKLKRGASGA